MSMAASIAAQDSDVDRDSNNTEEETVARPIPKEELTILGLECAISNTIPSFPVFDVQLKYKRWHYVDENGTVFVKDGFIRSCSSLNRTYPALVLVERGYSGALFIKVKNLIHRCNTIIFS